MAGRKSLSPEKRKGKDGSGDLIFAQLIQKRRTELGLTQTALAQRMGIPPPRVSEIEAGFFPSSRERIIALARALETTPDYLFGFREEP